MLKRITIYNAFWILLLTLILVRYELIYNGIVLLFWGLFELFSNPMNFIQKIDLVILDLLISIILILVIPLFVFIINAKHKIFKTKLKISYFVFMLLMFSLAFAPIISNFNPNAQPDIRATRFLSPLSSISVLHLSSNDVESKFIQQKNEIVNYPNISNRIFANEIKDDGKYLIYKQGNKEQKIEKKNILLSNGMPVLSKKYFIFGTDELGRDIFSRIIYGARITLFIACFTVIISITIGLLLGFLAAYFGGYLDLVLSRFTDIFLTIPSIFFVIMILAFWGNSIFAVIVVLGLTGWMSLFKIVKGEVASIIKKDYFISSQKLGMPLNKLLIKEIIPAIVVQLVIAIVFQFSNVILAESSLSYLGLGVGINYPSWGNMILSGQKYISSGEWLIIIPAIFLVIFILAINDFGEKIKRSMNTWKYDDK
jgi:peptide/nickel transport system permease protein